MFRKNHHHENIFDKRINEQKRMYDELLNKELESLNEKIKSEKYNIDTMISKTGLGNIYHDLIDSKDQLNNECQSKFNQTYHSIDVELYKLNKKLDNEAKLINYKYNNKKEKVVDQILTKVVG